MLGRDGCILDEVDPSRLVVGLGSALSALAMVLSSRAGVYLTNGTVESTLASEMDMLARRSIYRDV